MTVADPLAPAPPPPDPDAAELLALIEALLRELHPHLARQPAVTLDAPLDQALGLDSLGRVELLARVERDFDRSLPEQILQEAETPRDLLRALKQASPRPATPTRTQEDADASPPAAAAVTPGASQAEGWPEEATTLVDVLRWHVERHPQQVHVHLYGDSDDPEPLTYGDLWDAARAVAAGLQARGVEPGACVAIMLPTGRDYLASFQGILLAGCVPVPIYPPARPSGLEDHLRRHATILANARARLLITVAEARLAARLLRSLVIDLDAAVTVADLAGDPAAWAPVPVAGAALAFLQYTSGSTGNPKGVMLTHANLLANIRAMGETVQVQPDEVLVSWLPLYHDMGLIGAWLCPLYFGFPLVLMSPLRFLARPQRWLQAIHRHRGTISPGVNFAYELCVRRADPAQLTGVDLSSWRFALNGAEPVSPETLETFCERFAPLGFRREAMSPVYGLAECSVGLAFPPLGRGPRIDRVCRDALQQSGRAGPAAPDDPSALRFVGCGLPLPGHAIRILDLAGQEVGEREEGRLQFRGPSTTAGYYRNPEATAALFDGAWLESGDLAYVVEGEVYLTGRSKDVIIRAGRNIYPHQVEDAVGNLPGVRKGCVAVFPTRDAQTGAELLVVLAESRTAEPAAQSALEERIRAVTMEEVGVAPDDVVLAPPHSVLKTSSGKIRRAACRSLYEQGQIGVRRGVRLQVLRLALATLRPQLRRWGTTVRTLGYGLRTLALFGMLAPVAWCWVMLHRTGPGAWRAMRGMVRLAFRLSRLPVQVEGLEHLPRVGRCLLVSNHSSYLDAPLLCAALPGPYRFVAKNELVRQPIARLFLQRLGTLFVDRTGKQQGARDTDLILQEAGGDPPVFFFPEGTFTRAPGLRPFYLGAFHVAVSLGLPVVPIVVRGTRSVLRDVQWLPRRGTLRVRVLPPIAPEGSDWSAAVRLRDAVRTAILQHCGEPDLAGRLATEEPHLRSQEARESGPPHLPGG